ncbi:hypothetical protein H8959_000228 [Pygathrix nigripes]
MALSEQFSDEEGEPPKPEEGEPANQSQDPAPAQEGEDKGASAAQGEGKGKKNVCWGVCVCDALSYTRNRRKENNGKNA